MSNIQNLEGEIWKPIIGFEGAYDISNMGRVKLLARFVSRCVTGGFTIKHDSIKQFFLNKKGVQFVNLNYNGENLKLSVVELIVIKMNLDKM